MNRQYYTLFRTKTLNHANLKQKILQKYSNSPHNELLNFDQMLYLFDQQCSNGRCNRDIAGELFKQVKDKFHKATLMDMVQIYIQNLQTSKLCLKREEGKLLQLNNALGKCQQREKTFIFLKLVQVSIYSRFTKQPVLQYRIMPTDIPPVTLTNAINPVLNHQFILEMEEPVFDLIFYQSGIQIFRWSFPDQENLQQGEYDRIIQYENAAFQAKIKYVPKGKESRQNSLQKERKNIQDSLKREQTAFQILCNFQPFLEGKKNKLQAIADDMENQNCLIRFLPFLKQHVRMSYWLTIILLLLEVWASSFWPIEFLDIINCIYIIGLFGDLEIVDYSMKLLIVELVLGLLSVKSIWGAVTEPFFVKTKVDRSLLIACIVIKILLIIVISITRSRQEQIQIQRHMYVFGDKQQQLFSKKDVPQLYYNIWDDI